MVMFAAKQILQRIGEFAAAHPSTRVLLAPSPSDVIAAPVSVRATTVGLCCVGDASICFTACADSCSNPCTDAVSRQGLQC